MDNNIVILIILILLIFCINCKQKENFAWSNPNIIPGPVYSTYDIYDKHTAHHPGMWPGTKRMALGFHYISNCPRCDLMRTLWDKLKKDLANMEIDFVENNEEIARTPGIDEYPTIIKYQNGVGDIYQGFADYEKLRMWELHTIVCIILDIVIK